MVNPARKLTPAASLPTHSRPVVYRGDQPQYWYRWLALLLTALLFGCSSTLYKPIENEPTIIRDTVAIGDQVRIFSQDSRTEIIVTEVTDAGIAGDGLDKSAQHFFRFEDIRAIEAVEQRRKGGAGRAILTALAAIAEALLWIASLAF